ncbi:MAG: sugar ABC transporter permease [Acidimicrobiia bacterium]
MTTKVKRKKRSGLARREARLAYILLAPAVIVVLGLVIFPVLWTIALSLQRIKLIDLQNVNLFDIDITTRNFERVVSERDFADVLTTTFVYTVGGTVLSIGIGLWAAMALRKAFRGRSLVRGFVLFPYVAPIIAVTVVWKLMLNPTFGFANEVMDAIGFQRIDFLGRRDFVLTILGWDITLPMALSMVILFEAWRYFPFAFLFILARIQAMPMELEEAAMVDGASMWQRFRYVIFPQLAGVLSVLVVLRFIWTFNKFDDIFLLTGGAGGTEVVTVKIIDWLRGRADIGSAAALGLILAAILMVLIVIYFKFFFKEEEA